MVRLEEEGRKGRTSREKGQEEERRRGRGEERRAERMGRGVGLRKEDMRMEEQRG